MERKIKKELLSGYSSGRKALRVPRDALSFWIRHEASWLVFYLKREEQHSSDSVNHRCHILISFLLFVPFFFFFPSSRDPHSVLCKKIEAKVNCYIELLIKQFLEDKQSELVSYWCTMNIFIYHIGETWRVWSGYSGQDLACQNLGSTT